MAELQTDRPSPGVSSLSPDRALDCYRKMLLIRAFEEKLDELFADGLLRGTTHFCIGQEASAVGACAGLKVGDYVTSTHRGHGHAIACGADPSKMMAEIFGRRDGYCQGKGGTQHMACLGIGFLGSNGITGGGIPIATGAALSSKLRRTGKVALCFFGEGAANQGAFHECLNMAGLWKLPVIYCCENNQYAMGTPARQAFAVSDIAGRAQIYGMPGVVADGNDLEQVIRVVTAAAEHARDGQGPTLVELKTYRWRGHSRSDARLYRTRDEEAVWRQSDPIARWRDRLLQLRFLDQATDEAMRNETHRVMDGSVCFARASDRLSPEEVRTGVYR